MFDPITLPFGARMLFNTVKLRPGVSFEDVKEVLLNYYKQLVWIVKEKIFCIKLSEKLAKDINTAHVDQFLRKNFQDSRTTFNELSKLTKNLDQKNYAPIKSLDELIESAQKLEGKNSNFFKEKCYVCNNLTEHKNTESSLRHDYT